MGTIFKFREILKDYSKEVISLTFIIAFISFFAVTSIVSYGKHEIEIQKQIITPVHIGEGVYSFTLPFMSRRGAWEQTLTNFIKNNPDLRITTIQTMPSELKSKRDNVIMFVITEQR